MLEGWSGGAESRTEISRFINYFIKCAVGTNRKSRVELDRTSFSF